MIRKTSEFCLFNSVFFLSFVWERWEQLRFKTIDKNLEAMALNGHGVDGPWSCQLAILTYRPMVGPNYVLVIKIMRTN